MAKSEIVGIVAAAGLASRLGKLPLSKELLPVGFENGKTRVAADHLLESYAVAGVSQIHVIIRDGKWDIPAFYGSSFNNTPVCYHIAKYGYGVPFTVNQAYPFVKDKTIVFGFPDILFEPKDAFKTLLSKLRDDDETIVMLGSVTVSNPEKWDIVKTGNDDFVERILLKSSDTGKINNNWFIAAWKPKFTEFLNNFITKSLHNNTVTNSKGLEFHLGDVLNTALAAGIKIKNVVFKNGKSLDIGTPEDLQLANTFLQ
jgi:glucose-1-phosphate thymidylyltransferase